MKSRFVVLSQRKVEMELKYADFATAAKVSREHAERDGVPHYVLKFIAVSEPVQVAATKRLDEEELAENIRLPSAEIVNDD